VGRVFLVKLEQNQKSDDRSLKLGRAKRNPYTTKGAGMPDDDWVIPCDATEVGPGHWRLTPKKDLGAGEYGLYHWTLHGFGVD
jgi:hypothetical protein